jgi:hypothetical protein
MGTVTEIYVAKARAAGATGAVGGPTAPAAAAGFEIKVRFLGGLNQKQKDAFKRAADRWTKAIVGRLPPVQVAGEVISGVLITAAGEDIDGPGKILGQAGPTRLRPASAGKAAFIPATGSMAFDTADLADMEAKGTLNDVITHEMGHVIGIGTIWSRKKLLSGAGTGNPTFTGKGAMAEFAKLRGGATVPVPVEDTGGPGTADSHWRDKIFGNELMTGFVGSAGNPLSRMTIASLQDLGYEVDLSVAEPYSLPDPGSIGQGGLLGPHVVPLSGGMMLGHIPLELPDDALK